MPIFPKSYQKTKAADKGIPKKKQAMKVITAPNFYWAEALITDAAIPQVVSKITKILNMIQALLISAPISRSLV